MFSKSRFGSSSKKLGTAVLNSCFKTLTFLTAYHQWSLIPHRVKFRTEAVDNLWRHLETCKMLKIILSKLKLIKIHLTLFQHQLGFAMHLTWSVTNVTLILQSLQTQNLKRKMWGSIAYYVSPIWKSEGDTSPVFPIQFHPWLLKIREMWSQIHSVRTNMVMFKDRTISRVTAEWQW